MLERVAEGIVFVDKKRNAIKILRLEKNSKPKWFNLHKLIYAVANKIDLKDIDGDIHHINLNPFDDRPMNLGNLSKEEHRQLHKLLSKCGIHIPKEKLWK